MTEDELRVVVDMVAQHCGGGIGGALDSGGLSANAEAMRLLAHHGLLLIEVDGGRRVIAKWTPVGEALISRIRIEDVQARVKDAWAASQDSKKS